jgi:hypothetical protein
MAVLNLDFFSFHIYPNIRKFDQNRVDSMNQAKYKLRYLNEMFWYNLNSSRPWMIGETGFSAAPGLNTANLIDKNKLFGNKINQKDFANYSLESACNCGGSGYSYWEFQDVFDYPPNTDQYYHCWYGLLNRARPLPPLSNLYNTYYVKEFATTFRDYKWEKTGDCISDCFE